MLLDLQTDGYHKSSPSLFQIHTCWHYSGGTFIHLKPGICEDLLLRLLLPLLSSLENKKRQIITLKPVISIGLAPITQYKHVYAHA